MATDFSKPLTTDAYATLLPGIQVAISDLARQLDPALTGASTNIPIGTKRFNESTALWERYNGSAWTIMAATYSISISGNAATATSAITATNIAGGAVGNVLIQSAAGTTGFATPGTAGTVLMSNGPAAAPTFQTVQSFAAGVRLPFAEIAAPTGWTQITDDTATDRMLRVVNGSGRGTGGVATHSPTLMNVVPAHTHGGNTGYVSNDHSHGIGDPGHRHSISSMLRAGYGNPSSSTVYTQLGGNEWTDYAGTGIWTGGISANHYHGFGTDNGSSQTNWQPRYINLIICSKN